MNGHHKYFTILNSGNKLKTLIKLYQTDMLKGLTLHDQCSVITEDQTPTRGNFTTYLSTLSHNVNLNTTV